MTKFILGLCLFSSALSFAQIEIAAKANLLFPTENASWKSINSSATEAYQTQGKNKTGYNLGLSVEVDLVKNLSLMPEIYYTTFENTFTDSISNTTFEAKSNRVDLPVLLNYNLVSTVDIFAGPVASYLLSTDNQYNDFKENARNEFTIGYQFGLQFAIDKLIFTGRYEGSFTEDQRNFINNNSGQVIRYDNRPSLLIIGVGYRF